MIRLLPEEQAVVTQYVYALCSITLDESKGYLIEGRLGPVAEAAGCRSFLELVNRARSEAGSQLKRKIIDAITTNETLFFRDTSPFDLLRFKVIPEIIDRRNKTNSKAPIRIWSAACSTGQELYSVAMVLGELLGDLGRHNIRLFGTDVSDDAVARASAGVYTQLEVGRGLADATRARYFNPDPGGWKVRDEMRGYATFKRLNLMEDFTAMGKFDVIFCRNVAIYFSEPDRISLFRRLGQRLEPDGCLVIGSMESLSGICPEYESKRHLRSVYYQVKTGAAAAPAAARPPLVLTTR